MVVRRLSPKDLPAYRRLRLRALMECPSAFGSSYGEEVKQPTSHFRKVLRITPDTWVYGGFDGEKLVGIVRLVRNSRVKVRHKASLLGMYVAPSARRKGLGRALVEAAVSRSSKMGGVRTLQLSVIATNPGARAFYEAAGFREYGRERESLRVSGRFHAEILMAKRL
jgi:ribosomal protein S18 acetylase RimI-like enzyme